MEAPRGRIGATAEFATRMELGHHHFDARKLGLWFDIDRDSTPVVPHQG